MAEGKPPDYTHVRALIAIENPLVSRGTITFFDRLGLKLIHQGANLVQIQQVLKDFQVDLIVINAYIGDLFAAQLIRELRSGLDSLNSFAITILLFQQTDQPSLREIFDCGADDLLLMPISPQQLADRIAIFTERRKPFIVTYNYIGPDRRKQNREGEGEVIPLVEVPNMLMAKARQMPLDALEAEAQAATLKLTTLRLQRDGVQIRWLSDALQKLAQSGGEDRAAIEGHLSTFEVTCSDIRIRIAALGQNRLAPLVGQIESRLRTVLDQRGHLDFQALQKLLEFGRVLISEIAKLMQSAKSGG